MNAEFQYMRECQMWDQPKVDIYFVTIDDDMEPRYEIQVDGDGKIVFAGEFTAQEGEVLFVTDQTANDLQTCFDDYLTSIATE